MNKAMKVIFRKPWDTPSADLYKVTDNMTLDHLIDYETSKYIYIYIYDTRISNNFHLNMIHSNKGKNNSISSALITFNELPEKIKSSKSIHIVSKELKKYLLA